MSVNLIQFCEPPQPHVYTLDFAFGNVPGAALLPYKTEEIMPGGVTIRVIQFQRISGTAFVNYGFFWERVIDGIKTNLGTGSPNTISQNAILPFTVTMPAVSSRCGPNALAAQMQTGFSSRAIVTIEVDYSTAIQGCGMFA